jgi:hypothetical protein
MPTPMAASPSQAASQPLERPIKAGNPALPRWRLTSRISFSVSDPNAFNNAIYGQQTSAVTFVIGPNLKFTQIPFRIQPPHDPVTNPHYMTM